MRYLTDSHTMKSVDACSIQEFGIPSVVLMERAALGVSAFLRKIIAENTRQESSIKVVCVCGSGNNGADGIAVSRQLNENGIYADIVLAGTSAGTDEYRLQKSIAEKLGIHCDEYDSNTDFGEYDYHSPWYIVTMVFHEQEASIQEPMEYLNRELSLLGLENHCIHTGPIIRKEEEYSEMDYIERRKIFNKMVTFMRQSGVKYKAFHIEKKHIEDIVEATGKLSKQISVFIREHYDFLLSFDLVKIYYDNGQVELNKILSTLFNAFLPRVEFRKVKPSDYRLFQVADMICTFELLKLKIQNHSFSKSEQIFFGSVNDLKRNYLKIVKRQDIDH